MKVFRTKPIGKFYPNYTIQKKTWLLFWKTIKTGLTREQAAFEILNNK